MENKRIIGTKISKNECAYYYIDIPIKGIVKEKNDSNIICLNDGFQDLYITLPMDFDRISINNEIELFVRIETYDRDLIKMRGYLNIDLMKYLYERLANVLGVGVFGGSSIINMFIEKGNDPIIGIEQAINNEDVALFHMANGIGSKTAGKIVLELRDKPIPQFVMDIIAKGGIDKEGLDNECLNNDTKEMSNPQKEAIEILKSLGFLSEDINTVLNKMTIDSDWDSMYIVQNAISMLQK